MLGYPCVVATAVVWNPVENHFHPQRVGFIHNRLEIVECAIFGIHSLIVFHGIVAAKFPFAVEFRNGMDGHKPQDIHAQFLELRQIGFKSLESAFGGVLAHVHLINHGIARPFGVIDC